MDIKEEIAAEAVKIVGGARRAAYGKPERNFERIARLWNAHMENTLREPTLTATDVATFCRLIKEARLAETPDHRDSFVDLLGYTLCQAEIALAPKAEPVVPPDRLRAIIAEVYKRATSEFTESDFEEMARTWADAANADRGVSMFKRGDKVRYFTSMGEHKRIVKSVEGGNAESNFHTRLMFTNGGWMPDCECQLVEGPCWHTAEVGDKVMARIDETIEARVVTAVDPATADHPVHIAVKTPERERYWLEPIDVIGYAL